MSLAHCQLLSYPVLVTGQLTLGQPRHQASHPRAFGGWGRRNPPTTAEGTLDVAPLTIDGVLFVSLDLLDVLIVQTVCLSDCRQ